ncbi:Metalloprotease TldD [Candidatus Erwinia haradaeae]|uniref:Metalloprotease TldD n=1 Tax=Candidatus Erwinia haradaeae TaxID=1922217 RepID=A0A451DCF4_9GAMM|nr:metalloprotease TldD [Candidatus Erwinia haradaeae]VFP84111.1 Metalloprotease TldD [Candidatus Erwinia haradaeae]
MSIHIVSEQLLSVNNLSEKDLTSVLGYLSERKLTYGDLYFQYIYNESWMLENRIIKNVSYSVENGVGVRAIVGEKTGFAYANSITLKSLRQSALAARSIILEPNNGQCKCSVFKQETHYPRYSTQDPLNSLTNEDKISLLHQIDMAARQVDKRVQDVTINLTGAYEQVLIAATDGTLAADIRPLVLLSMRVQIEDHGKFEKGIYGGGGRYGYEFFLDQIDGEVRVISWARNAVRMALVNFYAVSAPAGSFPVVLAAGCPGVLLHEAVGHGLEGDFNRRGTSLFSGKIGEKVASELCTVVDNGTLDGLRGSLSIDDEGVSGKYNILIEKGILKGYMQDKMNARLMGVVSTGNARRASYAYLPIPRMTNTYILSGNSTPAEIIESVDFGLYITTLSSGQVDITSGSFSFSTSEAYLIKNGKVTKPVKGATLIGSGIEVMQNISMIGSDLALDTGVSVCSKEGQNIAVSVGQPTLKVDHLTVGGTS